jgi:DNA-binding transcriptional LysR family regulator
MNLTQLTVFREVMSSGSISQTAMTLGRTQPAISSAIKNLEENLGLKLFERKGRRLIPVPEAYYLVAEAIDVLDRLSTVSRTMKLLSNAESGSLNVATMPGPSSVLFPNFISKAIGDNTDIKISLSSRSSPQVRELAGTQSIDFGFGDLGSSVQKSPQYSEELISADCFCAIPYNHPLVDKDNISCTDLDGIPMGTLQMNHNIYKRTLKAFAKEEARFNNIIDSQTYLPLLHFIAAGQCCAIVDPITVVSENISNMTNGKVIFKPLKPKLRYDYAVLTPSHRPLSQLALKIKEGWKQELLRVFNEINADPKVR